MPLNLVKPTGAHRELILLYGPPGSGKTRLATSLTEGFGKIAYIALDEGSENLESVLEKYRERIDVFQPDFKNPVIDAALVSHTDWSGKGYRTIILDTFSNLTRIWLWYVTQQGLFQEKRNMIGEPGKDGSVALPDKGHYGGVHGIIRNFVTSMFIHNNSINIIFVCHQILDKDEQSGMALGGPATVGKAMLNEFPSHFKTVIRLDRKTGGFKKDAQGKPVLKDGKPVPAVDIIAHMAPHGAWIARRNENSPEGNPLTSLVLNTDPVNFWQKYEETSPAKGD